MFRIKVGKVQGQGGIYIFIFFPVVVSPDKFTDIQQVHKHPKQVHRHKPSSQTPKTSAQTPKPSSRAFKILDFTQNKFTGTQNKTSK